jgi:hypothetical protein
MTTPAAPQRPAGGNAGRRGVQPLKRVIQRSLQAPMPELTLKGEVKEG